VLFEAEGIEFQLLIGWF